MMKVRNKSLDENLKEIVTLNDKIKKLPKLSPAERNLVEAEIRFESTFYSNKFEGNKLNREEAKKAILF